MGVHFTIANTTLGRTNPDNDHVSALIIGVPSATAAPSSMTKDEPNLLTSITDAVNAGLDQTYDQDNFTPAYEWVREYFRFCPKGKLVVMFTNTPVTIATAVASVMNFLPDVKMIGIVKVADSHTVTNGIYAGLSADASAAQAVADALRSANTPVSFFLDGTAMTTPSSLPDISALDCPDVEIVIGQDTDHLDELSLDAKNKKYSCLGTVLGVNAQNPVHESHGWVQKGNLQGKASDGAQLFQAARFSNGSLASTYSSAFDTLISKGYTFPVQYAAYPGVFFKDDPTAGNALNNVQSVHESRTLNKAIRKTYTALLPFVNSPIQIDPETGKISPETITAFEAQAGLGLLDMQRQGNVSGYRVYVDPDQDVLTNEGVIVVSFWIVPVGCAREIWANISLVTSLPTA